MTMERSEWIWTNGRWVHWEDATVHVSAHALHYGSSVFEGIRAYATDGGPAIFRLRDHLRRLGDSARMMRMDLSAYPLDQLEETCVELVSRNRHESCYLRPVAFRGSGDLSLDPRNSPVEIAIFSIAWDRYLGAEAIHQGVDVAISSWRRFAHGTLAPLGKIGGQYVSNQFVAVEAKLNGYAEGLILGADGKLSEGSGENVFIAADGELWTPPTASSILAGITRDTVVTLAEELGVPVRFEDIPRDLLYLADEVFLTGTAAEITPVRSIDRLPVGSGRPGPITKKLQEAYFATVSGQRKDRFGWLTPVPPAPLARVDGALSTAGSTAASAAATTPRST